jgi:cytochrome c553
MKLNKLVTMAALATLSLTSAHTLAAGDPEAGAQKATVCASCHGKDGMALVPTYPNLAGQNQEYLVSALKAYKDQRRTGGQASIMQGQAAGLSEADMQDLAAYYSSLK